MRICPETDGLSPLLVVQALTVVWPALLVSPPTAAAQNSSGLVINEFFFRGDDSALEFVEVYNRSDDLVDLTTIQLSDNRRQPVAMTTSPRILGAGQFAVAVRDAEVFDARFDFPSRLELSSWPALNNSGDTIILWQNGVPIDSVAFRSSWGGEDVSLERLDPDGHSNHPTNWAESIDRDGGTPGRLNSVYAPDTTPPHIVFCEEIQVGLLSVRFSEPLDRPRSCLRPSSSILDLSQRMYHFRSQGKSPTSSSAASKTPDR